MNILVDTIRIAGFRGIKNLEVSLPRIAVLTGENNSGKTSLLKALQLSLGDYSRALSEEDFYIGSDGSPATEIIVDIRIVSVDSSGARIPQFSTDWIAELGDKIKAEAAGSQFVALRTRSQRDLLKGNFDTKRTTLDKWPNAATWTTEAVRGTNLSKRLESLPFFAVEAQRDIHQELRERTSFVGRVLSGIKYNQADVAALEELIKDVNDEAVSKSDELKSLKKHLQQLNKTFEGDGNVEITPLPKKIRDLSKHVSVHFGDNAASSFSMEYHGMGTRSWASLLTVKAFAELLGEQHASEVKPFFPILAAEEPEAHLHPNAQRALYRQLATSHGQVIVSTHSPYLASCAATNDLRALKRDSQNIKALRLSALDPEPLRRLNREVVHSRGEILFSKAIVLCEGETEEQALPLLFEKYFGRQGFELGISFVGVGGAGKYLPFFTFSRDFEIPVFIFSDGEARIVQNLKKHYESVFGAVDLATTPHITILDNNDFESYLITAGFTAILEAAIQEVEGPNAISDWITNKHGTSQGRSRTNGAPCTLCNQPIYADVLRDYQSSGGHEKAILDVLDSGKTKFAPVIANKLCELEKTAFPPRIIEFFDKIKTVVAV